MIDESICTLVVREFAVLVLKEKVPNADIGDIHIRDRRFERHDRRWMTI
jgi:hypothetical protein